MKVKMAIERQTPKDLAYGGVSGLWLVITLAATRQLIGVTLGGEAGD